MYVGLKNIGANYQKVMKTIFHDLLHDIMEDYVDDLLSKSKICEEHIPALRRMFERLEKYKLCLNPKKFVSRATSGKLLGFIVSHKVIEVDLAKVKEIMEMTPSKTPRQLCNL